MNPQVEKVIRKKIHVVAGLAEEYGHKVVSLNKHAVAVDLSTGRRLCAEYNEARRLFDLSLDGACLSHVSPALFAKKCVSVFAVAGIPVCGEADRG